MSYSQLYKKDTYVNEDLSYITSAYIREYDIQKANINILLKYGAIDSTLYDKLYKLPNLSRNSTVGLMVRDDEKIKNTLAQGFIESRRLFFEANNIQDYEVLSIKKDAIFLINKIASKTEFDGVNFINKNVYTSFYKVKLLEFYYYSDIVNNIEILDIKGISDESLHYHTHHMLDFIKYIFNLAETTNPSTIVTILSNFIAQYLRLELDYGFYREFNSMSKYNIKTHTVNSYYLDYLSDNFDKRLIDINYNRELLSTLFSYYSNMNLQNK